MVGKTGCRKRGQRDLSTFEILIVNVAFDQQPMTNEFVTAPLVRADRFASVVIVFEHGIVLETRV